MQVLAVLQLEMSPDVSYTTLEHNVEMQHGRVQERDDFRNFTCRNREKKQCIFHFLIVAALFTENYVLRVYSDCCIL